MPRQDLKKRTKQFALRVIQVYGALPDTVPAQIIGKQLFRSATSVGAHYRESVRARSNAEVISKLEVGLQELEESIYWMELLIEANIFSEHQLLDLMDEANQLIAIFVTIVKKIKAKKR